MTVGFPESGTGGAYRDRTVNVYGAESHKVSHTLRPLPEPPELSVCVCVERVCLHVCVAPFSLYYHFVFKKSWCSYIAYKPTQH
jgi:hypothetical protein